MTTQVENRSEIIEHQLLNGLKVLTKEVHAAPVASSYIWYKVGSRNERPWTHRCFPLGRTHAFQRYTQVLERGTWTLYRRQRWQMERIYQQTDYTAYYENSARGQNFGRACLGIGSDAEQRFLIQRRSKRKRTVILSEREGYENTPQFVLREEVQATAYKAHPYQWGIIGWPSDLKTMTREDLYNYYRQRYVPNNATLVLVGDFDTADLMKQVEDHFGSAC